MSEKPTPEFLAYQDKVRGTNINEETLLATDYLNHFNEVLMMLGMVADMPDCLEMAKEWQPKTYKEHFQDSAFSDKDLAIEAYDHVMPAYKEAFETTVSDIDMLIQSAIEEAESLLAEGEMGKMHFQIGEASKLIQRYQDRLNSIIHGTAEFLQQDGTEEDEEVEVLDQSDIDALFG